MNRKLLEVILDMKDKMSPGLRRAASQSTPALNRMANAARKLMAAIASLVIIRQAVMWVNKFIGAATVAEVSITKLTRALMNVPGATQAGVDALIEQAAALQQLTGIQDDTIINAQAMLSTFMLNAEGIGVLIPRILDMAAALQQAGGAAVDLQAISIAMGKVMTTGAGALAEYGVILSDVQGEQFNVAEGMDKINLLAEILDQNFAGLAEATGDTYEGALKKVKNTFLDLMEVAGSWITQSAVVRAVMGFLAERFGLVGGAAEGVSEQMRELVGTAFAGFINGVLWVGRAVNGLIRILLLAGQTLNQLLTLLVGWSKDLFINLGETVEGFAEGVVTAINWLVDQLNKVIEWSNQNLFTTFSRLAHVTWQGIIQGFDDLTVGLEANLENITGMLEDVDAATDFIIETQVGLAGAVANATTTINEFTGAVAGSDGAVEAMDSMAGSTNAAADAVETLNVALQNYLTLQTGPPFLQSISGEGRMIKPPRGGIGPGTPTDKMAWLASRDTTGSDVQFTSDVMNSIFASAIGGAASGGGRGAVSAALPIIGMAAFGPIGAAVGGFIGNLFGKKKRQGETPANPIFVKDIGRDATREALLNITKILMARVGAEGIRSIDKGLRRQAARVMSS